MSQISQSRLRVQNIPPHARIAFFIKQTAYRALKIFFSEGNLIRLRTAQFRQPRGLKINGEMKRNRHAQNIIYGRSVDA